MKTTEINVAANATPAIHIDVDDWKTPEVGIKNDSDCHIVGNKFYNLINEESHHSKWEEFRNLAREGITEECSMLLKKMELEDSDEEYDLLDDVMDEGVQQEAAVSLGDLGLLNNKEDALPGKVSDEENKKQQKRKPRWGPVERFPRPRRGQEDGRTMLQKAQDLKKIKNLEKGIPPKSFAFESNATLLHKAQCVDISFSNDTIEANKLVDQLKENEKLSCEQFREENPEVNLPGDLNVEVLDTDFPPLGEIDQTDKNEESTLVDQSWAQVVSTGKAQQNTQTVIK